MRRFRRRIGDIVTPVIEAGPEQLDEAVVFVHGNPGSAEEWAGLVARVGETTRAIATDMPGFGRADKPEDFEYTIAGYARHLADVIDTFGLRRVHLVMHDSGGPWGLRWIVDHPDRAGSVVLINAVGMPGYRWHLMARIWRTPGLGELAMQTTTHAGFRLALRLGNPVPVPRDAAEQMYEHFDAATRRAVLRMYRATETSDLDRLADELAAHDLPALVVWGVTDPYISITDAERFREVLPDARFVRIPDGGHWPHLSTPEAVEDAVLPWLRAAVTS